MSVDRATLAVGMTVRWIDHPARIIRRGRLVELSGDTLTIRFVDEKGRVVKRSLDVEALLDAWWQS